MTASRRRRDRGVTIVEAALGVPVFLLFVFGLVDLGMWSMNSNQAANAARDGARVAILGYEGADIDSPPSADHVTVVDAALAHLPGGTASADDVTVECVRPDGQTLSCAAATPEVDSIRVSVRWDWRLVTPIAGVVGTDRGTARGSATMLIVGYPLAPGPPASTTTTTTTTTTTAPEGPRPTPSTTTSAPCSATVSVAPAVVDLRGNDKPHEDVQITITTAGGSCTDLVAELHRPSGAPIRRTLGSGSGTQGWDIGKNELSGWTTGTGTVEVRRGGSIIGSTTFPIT